ncbi:MAG: cytochrome c biogenesis protein CcdA [Phycisphaerales bacterium]|jgi:thiol:disulfide interchange protein DsbD|nr:cytochrome c biogenesis protein CcdA [Phycisphaerales bacterium]
MRSTLAISAVLLLSAPAAVAAGPDGGFGSMGFNTAPPKEFHDSRDQVSVGVRFDRPNVPPGGDLVLAVVFDQKPGWHIHTHQPVVPPELGDASDYIATAIHASSPDGRLVPHTGWTQWPSEHEIQVGWNGDPIPYNVYEGRAIAWVPVTVPADASTGPATLTIRPVFQACDDRACMAPTPEPPEDGDEVSERWNNYGWTASVNIVPLDQATAVDVEGDFEGFNGDVFARIRSGEEAPAQDLVTFDVFGLQFDLDASGGIGLILLLLVAMIGGFLLNLTPCVLPVIPLKILAISGSSGHRSRTLVLGISMTLGVIMFWIGIGVAIAGVGTFTASNQLFQYPVFTIVVGLVIAAMAVGMCGLFSVRLPSQVYMVTPRHDTLSGSFLFGIMTAVLATPCTAPFMGAAMAWATTKPAGVTLITFASIGIGMALPYLVLSAFPKLTDRMPKAGPASELIKQVMGLLMLAAATYFVGVGLSGMLVDPPQPPTRVYFWAVAAVVIAAGVWLVLRTWQLTAASAPASEMEHHTRTDISLPRHALGWRGSMTILGALVAAAGVFLAVKLTDHGPISWVWYTPEKLEEAFDDDKVVVMEFTAEWCLNCKALEETVLHADSVVSLLAASDVEPIKVDLTGNNESGNAMLNAVGRHQIPLLVVFAPDGTEVFKGDFYNTQQVLKAVEEARQHR